MNRWDDQPAEADGEDLFYQHLTAGFGLQIQKTRIAIVGGKYAVTVGNLFGSETLFFDDLETLLRDVNTLIDRSPRR